jgi:hypothetical protein
MSDLSLYNGSLEVRVTSSVGLIPIKGAVVRVSYSGRPSEIVRTVTTDESGISVTFLLPSPKPIYSEEPSEEMPYSEYDISVTAEGYEPVTVFGTEILPNVTAIQPVSMTPLEIEPIGAPDVENIVIPDHTLYGDYPSKIPEAEVKPTDETGEIVLSRVVIPEYIVVHDGVPSDSSAKNYYVRYTDYIKNVVSSEIYATWSENTIYANTLAIMSFTLNRVYTEW